MKERLLVHLAAVLVLVTVALPAIPVHRTTAVVSISVPVLPDGDCQGGGSCGG